MWGEPELTCRYVALQCAHTLQKETQLMCHASVQSFTLVIALILGSYTLVSLQLPCIQASVGSLSRWLALITSLQPALSLFR